MPNLILGVSGSVAAYRAADLAREFMRQGFSVRVCLTDSAQKFVTPALFEALTGQPCLIETFEEPERGRMAHIDWARWADAILIAPATANTLTKIAFGLGEDMLTTLVLASTRPLFVAPAMNPAMYENENTQEALDRLRARAVEVIEPVEGDVACGENGQGKLASIDHIIHTVKNLLDRGERLKGYRVLLTSGPTQEPVDAARFLTNRSSGKMGAAIARAALMLGAEVTVVSGPSRAKLPKDVHHVPVRTALQMHDAALALAPQADLILGVAAVADYRPSQASSGKIRRSNEPITLQLLPNPDIIAALVKAAPRATVVGFAAEPGPDMEMAREKLERKGLFALAINDIARSDIAFEADSNEIRLLFRDGRTLESGKRSKLDCALWLLESLVPERVKS